MPTAHQRHGRTDRRTDGRPTYDSNTALRASRGNNVPHVSTIFEGNKYNVAHQHKFLGSQPIYPVVSP